MKKTNRDYRPFERALFKRLLRNLILALVIIFGFYYLFWKGRGGDILVDMVCSFLNVSESTALSGYQYLIRDNAPLLFILSTTLVFFILLLAMLRSFIGYFELINDGINALLLEDGQKIRLVPELASTENKLNTVKATLSERKHNIETANQKKDDMILYLAHDIRTPLTSVIGYLDLLAEDQVRSPEDQARYIAITRNKAGRLEELIEEFFQIAKAQSLSDSFGREELDLILLLRQIIDEFYPSLKKRGLEVAFSGPASLPVHAESILLMRALSNLLRNAVSYAPAGSIIRMNISADAKARRAEIALMNEAPLMTPLEISRLFEKFYRRDPSRSSRTGGSGLGLPIAKDILEMHGGDIRAYYEDGQIHFLVSLPL